MCAAICSSGSDSSKRSRVLFALLLLPVLAARLALRLDGILGDAIRFPKLKFALRLAAGLVGPLTTIGSADLVLEREICLSWVLVVDGIVMEGSCEHAQTYCSATLGKADIFRRVKTY